MQTDERTFWMIWSPSGHPPTHRHQTYESARVEAERLARSVPGSEFFILQAVGMRQMDSMRRIDFAVEVPF